MKLLCGGTIAMVLMAGVIVEQEPKMSSIAVFFLASIGGTFTSLATYLLAGKNNDSHSLAIHLLGNVGIAGPIGGMVAMHGAPLMTGIPGDDVFQIVFVGGLLGISGFAVIAAIRGMLTVETIQMMAARAFGLDVPKRRSKSSPSAQNHSGSSGSAGSPGSIDITDDTN